MEVTKKKLKQLRQKIIILREEQVEARKIETKLGDLSREILDILEPPKKGYIRFATTDGWVSFKQRRKVKK